jgi:hypothetical protein
VLRILGACSRGGKLRYFLLPWYCNSFWLLRRLWRGGYYAQARDAVWDFVVDLRLPYYFWLGVRGFVGGLAWLVPPITLLALGRVNPLFGLLGGLFLAIVLQYVPFLQMRFARENRFRAFFELRGVRADFKRAPVAFAFAFFFTLLLAVPLFLLKIEMVPREVAYLFSLFFIVSIFPAKLLAGWAYGRAVRQEVPRHWLIRWSSWLVMLPSAVLYVLILTFTEYTSWGGLYSLYEQHAFLLPVPFLGLRN